MVALVAMIVAGALTILVAYAINPLTALLLPVAAVGAAAIWRQPTLGVCTGILAVPLEPFGLQLSGAADLAVTEVMLGATAIVVGAQLVLERHRPPLHGAHRAFAALLAVVVAGYLVAEDDLIVTKILVMWFAFLLVSIHVARAGERDLRWTLASLAAAGGVVGLIAVVTSGEQDLVAGGAIASGRAQASFDQPNVLGFFLALTAPIAMVLSAEGRSAKRLLWLVAAALALAGLLLTLSRTSIVGTAVALAVLLALPSFRRFGTVALAALLIFSLFNVDTLLESRQLQVVGTRLGTLTEAGLAREDVRFDLWSAAPEMIFDRPLLGAGQGNYAFVSPRYGLRDPDGLPWDHAHNVPLTVAVESGLLGLAALLVFASSVALAGRAALRDRGARIRPLVLGLVAAMLATTVTSMGDYPLRTNAIMATIMIEVGALIACARLTKTPQPPRQLATPPRSSARA
jgi:O-antigen ligase